MERQAITVRGIIQGVGFRPYVHGLASRLQLSGFVQNRSGAVWIEVEGEESSLHRFREEIETKPPPLARIDELQWQTLAPLGEAGFRIEPSDANEQGSIFISPDVATCDDCLRELFDPDDRRYRYPFLNCTNCGPRLTIIRGAPYDRERPTMAGFAMCGECRAEYEDPADRRFHAQPTACPRCGPHLTALRPNGEECGIEDPLAEFVERILAGEIGALKGLGGFHLVCDARHETVVAELRRRKHRDEKPFAVMVRDLATAQQYCHVDDLESELLISPRRPIVLLRKRVGPAPACQYPDMEETSGEQAAKVCPAIAPGNPYLGVMLPYTPLHYLLMEAVGDVPLVMTSGNRSDEPIAYTNDDAFERLGNIADLFLIHNRPIHVRCDDSVTRIVAGQELPLRRSRGYAPEPLQLPRACPTPLLAVGGQLKGVFALGREHHAFLSHHLGDLDHYEAYHAFERDIRLYEELFEIRPAALVHDLHPDYASTAYARRRAEEEGLQLVAVQHHHAHMASCMAEHGLTEPVIGVSFDGTGYGTDGAIWGGEFLTGDYGQVIRGAHLRYVPLPGGDQAIRQPWRSALSHLVDAGCPGAFLGGVSSTQRRTIEQMIERSFNSPLTSSVGRLFDAVAAIAGVRSEVSYEGQAAVELEWLATEVPEDGCYPFEITGDEIDTRPLIEGVAQDVRYGTRAALVARRFHSTLVEMIAAVCEHLRAETDLNDVVLSGGVFLNALLTRETCRRLADAGFRVYRHRLVPPGDGGLCLGQLAVAAQQLIYTNPSNIHQEQSSSVCTP